MTFANEKMLVDRLLSLLQSQSTFCGLVRVTAEGGNFTRPNAAFSGDEISAFFRLEDSPEHTELAGKQHPLFQQSWIEFYEVLEY